MKKKREVLLNYLEKAQDQSKKSSEKKPKEVAIPSTIVIDKPAPTINLPAVAPVADLVPISASLPAVVPIPSPVIPVKNDEQVAVELKTIQAERLKIESIANKRALLEQELENSDNQEIEKKQEEKKQVIAKKQDEQKSAELLVQEKKHEENKLKQQQALEKEQARLQVQQARKKRWQAFVVNLKSKLNKLFVAKEKPSVIKSKKTETKKIHASKPMILPKLKIHWSVKQWFWGGLTMIIGFYLTFMIAVYTFVPRNFYFRLLGYYLPVPAVMTSQGFIDFYAFLDSQKGQANLFELGSSKSAIALKKMLVLRIAERYQLSPSLDYSVLVQSLRRKILADFNNNYYTAQKYHQLILALKTSTTLDEVATKADLKIKRKSLTRTLFMRDFQLDPASLPDNNLSKMIINKEGIYVLSLNSTTFDRVDFDYVFVPAVTLEELIKREMETSWMISFVD